MLRASGVVNTCATLWGAATSEGRSVIDMPTKDITGLAPNVHKHSQDSTTRPRDVSGPTQHVLAVAFTLSGLLGKQFSMIRGW